MDINSHLDLLQNELKNAVFQKLQSAPATPAEGQVYYNTSDQTSYQWNGTEWVAMKNLSAKLIKVKFEAVDLEIYAPKKNYNYYYTKDELVNLLQDGNMIIAIEPITGQYFYPDGSSNDQLLFRKTGVEDGAFVSKLLEMYSHSKYGEVWKITTDFSIKV